MAWVHYEEVVREGTEFNKEKSSFCAEFAAVSIAFADLSGRIGKLRELHEQELLSTKNDLSIKTREFVDCKKTNSLKYAQPPSLFPHAPPSREEHSITPLRSLESCRNPCCGEPEIIEATPQGRGIAHSVSDDDCPLPMDVSDCEETEFMRRQSISSGGKSVTKMESLRRREFTLRKLWLEVDLEAFHACTARFEVKVNGLMFNGARRTGSFNDDFGALISRSSLTDPKRRRLDIFSIMHPYGFARLVWTCLSLGLIAFDFLIVPLQAFDISDGQGLAVLEWTTAFLWTLDMVLWFRTGYYENSTLDMRPKHIALHYAKTWLATDFIIVTSQWVIRISSLFISENSMRSSSLLQILGFMTLFRVVKLRSIWLVLRERIVSNVVHYCSTVVILMLLQLAAIHVIACLWYLLGIETDGWPTYEEYSGSKDTLFWYVASSRWVIAQLNGRTDIDERRNLWERFFTCVVGVTLALLANAVWVSVITRTMLELRELFLEKTRRRRIANEYLLNHPVNADLSRSVKRYLNDYQDANKALQMEESIIANLPKHVQIELLFEVRSPILTTHSLFRSLSAESLGCVRNLCHRCIKPVAAVQFEVVFDRGDTCSRMLFMDKVVARYGDASRNRASAASMRRSDSSVTHTMTTAWHVDTDEQTRSWPVSFMANKLFSTRQPRQTYYSTAEPESVWGSLVKAGSCVSEAALWTEWINRGRLVAEEHGQIYALEAHEFAGTLQTYQEAYALASLYAKSMVEELRKKLVPSDILHFVVELMELTPIQLQVIVVSAQGLANADGLLTGRSHGYCVCSVVGGSNIAGKKASFTTPTINNCSNPVWNCEGLVSISERQSLHFELWNEDFGQDQLLGEVTLDPVNFLANGFEGELTLTGGCSHWTLTVKVIVESDHVVSVASNRSTGSKQRHSWRAPWTKRRSNSMIRPIAED